MERLLADAQKFSGVEYDINNLSDVYDAIHVIQGELDITGTTAKEASETFSGSFASMKAAASNLLGNMSLGDSKGIMESSKALVLSVKTFLIGNLLPMVKNIVASIPDIIIGAFPSAKKAIKQFVSIFTDIYDNGVEVAKSIASDFLFQLSLLYEYAQSKLTASGVDIKAVFSSIFSVFEVVTSILFVALKDLGKLLVDVFAAVAPIWEAIAGAFTDMTGSIDYEGDILQGIFGAINTVFSVASDIIVGCINWIVNTFTWFKEQVETDGTTINSAIEAIGAVWSWLEETVGPIIETVKDFFKSFGESADGDMSTVEKAIYAIQIAASIVSDVLGRIFNTISGIFEDSGTDATGLYSTIKWAFDWIKFVIDEALNGVIKILETVRDLLNGDVSLSFTDIRDLIEDVSGKIGEWIDGAGEKLAGFGTACSELWTTVQETWTNIKDTITGFIDDIKGALDFEWSFPDIALPHFEITDPGSAPWGIGGFGSLPKWNVVWNAKAMVNPYLLTDATIFGAAGGQLLGGGETGQEIIYGRDALMSDISEASGGREVVGMLRQMMEVFEEYFPQMAQNKVLYNKSAMVSALAEGMNGTLSDMNTMGGW